MKIYVIGGANIDITGKAIRSLILKDSNPGNVSFSFGGVARNIAENLARLGHKPIFISAFSDDMFGLSMLKHLETLGVNIKHSLVIKKASTSTYLALLNDNNDMEIAVSDTAILKNITSKYLAPIIKKIKSDDLIVLDTNLEPKTLDYIFKHSKAKIIVDPISTTKALKIKPYLKQIYAIKPNIYEAEVLTGLKLNKRQDIKKAAAMLHAKGVKKVFISLGKMGALGSVISESHLVATGNVHIKSATGAGDAFMAGIVDGEINNKGVLETLKFATGCSLITLQSLKTVSDQMSQKNVVKLMKRKG